MPTPIENDTIAAREFYVDWKLPFGFDVVALTELLNLMTHFQCVYIDCLVNAICWNGME